ncbi:hypothetical protein [Fluviicola sp.]|jgi:hypothetical protein|uniref:hypothetical protein n=1 Tax=Fluviicola sp. TaxID=1917219 RepID=UPI00281C559E|nr:hypothetical protein [Fluviicola sp.]MDR0801827.1 hypothetical protein [Fluviicola sp.]
MKQAILSIGILLAVVSCKKETAESNSSVRSNQNTEQKMNITGTYGGTKELSEDEAWQAGWINGNPNLFNLDEYIEKGIPESEFSTEARINIIVTLLAENPNHIAEMKMVDGILSYTIRELTTDEMKGLEDGTAPFPLDMRLCEKAGQGVGFLNCVRKEVEARGCVKVTFANDNIYQTHTC